MQAAAWEESFPRSGFCRISEIDVFVFKGSGQEFGKLVMEAYPIIEKLQPKLKE